MPPVSGLVPRSRKGVAPLNGRWPGATSAKARNGTLHGLWFDRTAEYHARQRGDSVPKMRFAERVALRLTPIPSWQHLTEHQAATKLRKLLASIAEDTQQAFNAANDTPMGAQAILEQQPHARPERSKRSPAPRFHACRGYMRRRLEYAYLDFFYGYRTAVKRLRAGKKPLWPPGVFLPSSQFVPYPT